MNRKGFTFVELCIVVAIIGILSAIAIPQFQDYKHQKRMKETYGESYNPPPLNSSVTTQTHYKYCPNCGKELK